MLIETMRHITQIVYVAGSIIFLSLLRIVLKVTLRSRSVQCVVDQTQDDRQTVFLSGKCF